MSQLFQISVGGNQLYVRGPRSYGYAAGARGVSPMSVLGVTHTIDHYVKPAPRIIGIGALDDHTYRVVGGIAMFVGFAAVGAAIAFTYGRL